MRDVTCFHWIDLNQTSNLFYPFIEKGLKGRGISQEECVWTSSLHDALLG